MTCPPRASVAVRVNTHSTRGDEDEDEDRRVLGDRAVVGDPRPQARTKPTGPRLGVRPLCLRAGASLSDHSRQLPVLLTFKLKGNKNVKFHLQWRWPRHSGFTATCGWWAPCRRAQN